MLSFLQYVYGFFGHVHCLYPSGEFGLRIASEKVDAETPVILHTFQKPSWFLLIPQPSFQILYTAQDV